MAGNGLDLAALVDETRGLVSMKAYADQDVFEVEQERVFGRAWLYVGHETEIPRAGDYVTRQMAQDPVILVRDNHGVVRVFLNMCPHRGSLLVRAEAGNAPSYNCNYHGWTYENTGRLLATCHAPGLYESLDTHHKQRLVEARVGTYAGLILQPSTPNSARWTTTWATRAGTSTCTTRARRVAWWCSARRTSG